MFVTLILFVIFLVLSELLKPKPKIENARPAGLGDFQFPTATEGRPVPLFWGTVKLSGPNVVWYGALRQLPIVEKVKTGMFSSKKVIRGYRYYLGVQMALSRGGTTPVGSLLRIWVGDDVAWTGSVSADGGTIALDLPSFLGGDDLGNGGIGGTIRFHSGSYTQGVNSYLAGFQSIGGQTSAYRGTFYVVLEDFYLGNSTQIKPWAFEARRIPNGLGLATPSVNSGNDANPMNVAFEIFTNTEWGLGLPSSDIDTADFTAAAATLLSEGNGFSFVLDNQTAALDLLGEIERQIDGVFFLDRTTGKWRCNLARGGYTLATKLAVTPANIIEVQNFARGAWDDTTNNVLIKVNNRALDYKETYATAQDMANIRLQGNRVVTVEQLYPGVKDGTLANTIAWRNLRTLSYPLARATLVCDRSVYAQNPGDVVRWTDPDLGFTDLPMRIVKLDLGLLTEGKIVLQVVQDIFTFDSGSFTAPGATNWVPPPMNVVAIPTGDSLVFEAPKGFVDIDPEQPGVLDRIWVGARYQNDSATDITVVSRPGAGSYTEAGNVSGFLVAGSLNASMDASGTQGSISITLTPSPDALAFLQAATTALVTQQDVGTLLANLVMVDSEFFGFTTVAPSGPNLVLSGGYRALLDSAPAAHSSSARVWVLLGNLTDRAFAPGSTQNIKLLPRSRTNSLAEGSATAINVTMNNRGRRPYPPVNFKANSTAFPTGSVDIDNANTGGPGTGLDDRGIAVDYTRRDYRLTDEAAAVVSEVLPADFPTANTTQYAVEVRNDPAGANTLLFTSPFNAGASTIELSRSRILRFTSGVVPSRLRMTVKTQHVDGGVTYAALQNLVWDFNVTASIIGGSFNFGVLANGVSSATYTAANTGTFTLTIGAALASGNVEVNVAGGGFVTVISSGNTTGTFSATSGDSIVVRHTQAGSTDSQTFCALTFGGASKAYAILTY